MGRRRGAAAGAQPPAWPRVPRPHLDRLDLAMTVAALAGAAGVLFSLALRLAHSVDEVHGFLFHASLAWDQLLTTFPVPGHPVLFNLLLKASYPFVEGTRLELRWVTLVTSLATLTVVAALVGRLLPCRVGAAATANPVGRDRVTELLLRAARLLWPLAFALPRPPLGAGGRERRAGRPATRPPRPW